MVLPGRELHNREVLPNGTRLQTGFNCGSCDTLIWSSVRPQKRVHRRNYHPPTRPNDTSACCFSFQENTTANSGEDNVSNYLEKNTEHSNHPISAANQEPKRQLAAATQQPPPPTMHSTFTRVQNVFGFFTTVAFALGAFIAVTDVFAPRTPSASLIKPTNVQVVKGRPHYYSSKKEEYAILKFSLEADLSSLFTWNTKNLFVYVTAEWPAAGGAAGGNVTNEAVIWDSIITSPSADHLQNLGPKAMKELKASAKGKSIAPERFVSPSVDFSK